MKYSLLLFLLLICIKSTAQPPNNTLNEITKIVPPSPESAAIEKYSNIPVSYSTGVPNISYPLWSWKRGLLEFNVSLSYHAGGHKVDDMATHVGLGWNLNGFGRISRTIKGQPDDRPVYGYLYRDALPDIGTELSNDLFFYIPRSTLDREGLDDDFVVSIYNSPSKYNLLSQLNSGLYDAEQDVFSFSFNNNSVRFVINNNHEIVTLEPTNIKLEAIYEYNSTLGINTWIKAFYAIDEDGVKYKFELAEYQNSENSNSQLILTPNYTISSISAWLLTTIVNPFTNDSITIDYVSAGNNLKYISNFSESETTDLCKYDFGMSINPDVIWGLFTYPMISNYSIISASTLLPSLIKFPDGSELKFNHLQNRLDYAGAYATSSITVHNSHDIKVKEWNLDYSYFNCAAGIFDFSQDISSLLTSNDLSKRLRLDSIKEISSVGNEVKKTIFQYNELPLNIMGSRNTDFWGYNVNPARNNAHYMPEIPLNDIEKDLIINNGGQLHQEVLAGANKNPDKVYAQAAILKKIIYPTGGFTEFEFESNSAFSNNFYEDNLTTDVIKWYYNTQPTLNIYQQLSMPGRNFTNVEIFIKSIEHGPRPENNGPPYTCIENQQDYNNIYIEITSYDNSYTTTLNYVYGDLYNGTSFILALPLDKNYKLRVIYNVNSSCDEMFPFDVEVKAKYFVPKFDKLAGGLRVKSIISNDGHKSYTTSYKYIDVNGNSSGELTGVPDYGYSRTTTDYLHTENIAGNNYSVKYSIPSINRTNSPRNTLNFYNGTPLIYTRVIEENSDGSKIIREYDPFIWERTNIYNTPFTPTLDFPNLSGLLLNEIHYNDLDEVVQTNEYSYTKTLFKLPIEENRNISLAVKAISLHPSSKEFFISREYTYTIANALQNLANTKVFSGSGFSEVIEFKEYNLKNYLHKQTVNNSKGENIVSKFWYPFDAAPNFPIYNTMVSKNMLKTPVIKQQFKEVGQVEEPLWEQKTNYGTFNTTMIMPSNVSTSILDETPFVEMSVDAYDSKGNICQYTGKDRQIHSFIWGYNHTYPVAHVIGADYNSIKNLVNEILLNNPASTDQQIITELNNFRNSLTNQNVQVTTYTYIPLVGIKTITDLNGKTATYEYDNFWRLKLVRDHNGNIISAQDYQYAQ